MSKSNQVAGKAIMGTITDVEPLLRALLLEQKRKAGLASFVTDDEVRAAASAFGDDVDQNGADRAEDVRALMGRSLPEGVRVEKVEASRRGTQVTSSTTFAFDDIRLLRELEVFFERGRPSRRPFASLAIEQDGGALVVEGMPPELETDVSGAPQEELVKNAVTLELEVALPVVAHNATRSDGQRLIWEIDGLKMSGRKSDDKGWIHVEYQVS